MVCQLKVSPVPPEPSPITPGPVNQSHQLAEETEEDKAERSSQEKDGI